VRAKNLAGLLEVTDRATLTPKIDAEIQRTPRSELLGACRQRCTLPEIRNSRGVQETFSATTVGGEWLPPMVSNLRPIHGRHDLRAAVV